MIGKSRILSKLGAIGILLLAFVPLGLAALYVAEQQRSKENDIQDIADKYDRFRSVASFDVSKLEAGAGQDTNVKLFLGEGPPAVLTSSLQARLREIAVQRGVDIIQAGELKPVDIGTGLVKLGVRLEMSGPQQGIHSVLQQIEQSVPWLFAENIQLRSGFIDVSEQATEPPLSLGLDVWGVVPVQEDAAKPK